jgi:hypothetical protein
MLHCEDQRIGTPIFRVDRCGFTTIATFADCVRQGPGMDRPRVIISALAVAVCVAGCATAWVRPDAESVELNREHVECQFEASKLTASAGLEGADAERKRAELEVLCMEAKGWSRR